MKVIAATHNKGKIREFNEILGKLGFEVLPPNEVGIDIDPEENGSSFAENALIKARAVANLCDYPVIADDSGLCVDALGGAPGIFSARYAGEDASDSDRIKKLLHELDGVSNRRAKFVSAIAFIMPDGEELVTHGEVLGNITLAPDGDSGFGYDPIFQPEGFDLSFAEMPMDEKNKISHRGRAIQQLIAFLKEQHNK